jgi:hypothetical protein
MVCLGCLENKYFPRHLIFGAGKKDTEPSGILLYYLPGYVMYIFDMCLVMYLFLILKYLPVPVCTPRPGTVDM